MHFRSRRRLANSLGSGNNPRSEYLRTVSKTGRSAHPFSDKSYINHAAERRTAKLPTHTVIPDSMKHTRSAGKAAAPEFLPREQVEQKQAALRPCFRGARVAGTAA